METKKRVFATRTLKDVPLTFENVDGERVTEMFTVKYRSYSRSVIEELQTSVEGAVVPYSVLLSTHVTTIIDKDDDALTGDDGRPADLSNGFFDTMDVNEAKALWERIEADIFPQTASPAPGDSGSQAVGSEA